MSTGQTHMAPQRIVWNEFLNTGPSIFVLSQELHLPPQSHVLFPPTLGRRGARNNCLGSKLTPLQFQVRQFTWDFTIAEVKKLILGTDFLFAHGLAIDMARTSNKDMDLLQQCSLHTLSDKYSPTSSTCGMSTQATLTLVLRLQYQESSTASMSLHSKVGPHSSEKLDVTKTAFKEIDASRVIHYSNLPKASLLHMVCKKNSRYCPFSNYRGLNGVMVPDQYCNHYFVIHK